MTQQALESLVDEAHEMSEATQYGDSLERLTRYTRAIALALTAIAAIMLRDDT